MYEYFTNYKYFKKQKKKKVKIDIFLNNYQENECT